MLKKILLAVVTLFAAVGMAFAQVEVNKADQAALDGVKGIGPKMSKTIIDERAKNGEFKDWADFQKRVKGVGDKNSANLSKAGLTVNGQAKEGAPADAKKADAKDAKKTDAKMDAKTDTKDAKKSDGKKDDKAAASMPAPAAAPAAASDKASKK